MDGDGKANVLCSQPSINIWLCQKVEKNDLKSVILFLFLPFACHLPQIMLLFLACCAVRGGACGGLVMWTLASCLFLLSENYVYIEYVLTPSPHYSSVKTSKNEYLAKKPF